VSAERLKVSNSDSAAYDVTNDAMKVESVGNSFFEIAIDDITNVANDADGNTGWVEDARVKYAKVCTLYYTASQNHNLTTKFDHSVPAAVGYFAATTNTPYHSGSIAGLGSVSQRVVFAINDANLIFYFTNKSGGTSMNITNIKVRFQY
jgi:hypothetical protein